MEPCVLSASMPTRTGSAQPFPPAPSGEHIPSLRCGESGGTAMAAGLGAALCGMARAALTVGAAVPAGSSPSQLLYLSALAAGGWMMTALCFMGMETSESCSGMAAGR